MESKTKINFNIVAIVCIIVFCGVLAPITLQNDTFYTIRIGEHILENGIDMHDPFSIHDIPYTYPHWLYDVGIYLIYKVGGMLGIYISTIVLSCILGLTIYYANKKITKNYLVSFLLTLGVMYVLRGFIAARAQLLTYILFTLQILFIEQFIETKKKRYALGLIVIPIIIANVHLAVWPFYFIPFLPYIAEYLIAVLLDTHIVHKLDMKLRNNKIRNLSKKQGQEEKIAKLELINKKKEEKFEKEIERQKQRRENPYKLKIIKKDNVKWLIVIAIICMLTGLLTPLGDTPYTYLVKTMQGNTTKSINEHLPMVLIESSYTLAIIAIVLSVTVFTDTKIRLKDFFMLGGLIVLALMSRRQLSMLVLLGVYSINRLLTDLFYKYDKEGLTKFTEIIASGFGKIITILLIVLLSIAIYKSQIGDKFIDANEYPVEASKYIKEQLNLEEIRLYNEYNYGSYLLYEGIPVFIDSRADLYTPEFNGDKDKDVFTDFIRTSALNVHYETIFNKYDITHLIIPNNAKINLFVSKDDNYKELYKDSQFVIYERLNK
ncbi:MAG: hypothetical protein HFJ57_03460 [Clostridia bacterium]|nr:hypothetical protein [Clostridia bacterium]